MTGCFRPYSETVTDNDINHMLSIHQVSQYLSIMFYVLLIDSMCLSMF